ncbi:MAG TPA: hypothetical protein G4N94_08330 [Caldilineae bacterium]|nr:hypothetical protein [Caldilineae bacterium]
MKRILSTVLLLTLLILALAACGNRERPTITGEDASPDAIPDLVGSYSLNGIDPKGNEYGGVLIIKAGTKPGEYAMQWLITGAIQEGTGRVVGNQLLAEWRSIEGMEIDTYGEVTYTITTKGELYGPRTAANYDGEGTEIAFPNDENWGEFHLGPQLKK